MVSSFGFLMPHGQYITPLYKHPRGNRALKKPLELRATAAHDVAMKRAGKIAIVTGAGSCFGAGIAQAFAREGARVLVADIDGDAASIITGVALDVDGGRCI